MKNVIAALLLCFLLVAPALANEKVDLRGPAMQAGEVYLTAVQTKTKEAGLNMVFSGQQMQGTMQVDSVYDLETAVLEVKEQSPTKVQTKFVKAKSTTKMDLAGEQQTQDDTTMQGAVMTQVFEKDKWVTSIKGGQIPQEAKDLIKHAGFMDPRVSYPEGKVAVGHKWKIAGAELQAFMGQTGIPGATLEGEMKFELAAVKEIEGRPTAVINFDIDAKVLMGLSPQQGATVSFVIGMDGKGEVLRDLTDYRTTQNWKGEMDMLTNVEQAGNTVMTMDAKMPVEVKATARLKKPENKKPEK